MPCYLSAASNLVFQVTAKDFPVTLRDFQGLPSDLDLLKAHRCCSQVLVGGVESGAGEEKRESGALEEGAEAQQLKKGSKQIYPHHKEDNSMFSPGKCKKRLTFQSHTPSHW